MRVDVVVPAAGSSRRMAGHDKLRAAIGGRPLLAWTLDALASAPVVERIVVVVAPGRVAEVRRRDLASAGGGRRGRREAAPGVGGERHPRAARPRGRRRPRRPGPRRGEAARDPELVARVAAAAAHHGAAIPVVPVTDTLKRVRDDRVEATVDRADLAAAQTPQGARFGLFEAAFERLPPAGPATWTDEAACWRPVPFPSMSSPVTPETSR